MINSERVNVGGLHVLVHESAGPENSLQIPTVELTRGIAENGATFIQLRDKHITDQAMISLGIRMRAALPPQIPLLINDRATVALAIRDSGVKGLVGLHVGQDETVTEIRQLIGNDMILGVSVANVEQARRAVADGASYLGVGPIFQTRSKIDAGNPIGLRGLEKIRHAVPGIGIIAIGGITTENARAVMKFGADGVAVIGAVLRAGDPIHAAEELSDLVIPRERLPRLDEHGVFTQQDAEAGFIGRTISRQEAETNNGNIPVARVFLFKNTPTGREVLLQQRGNKPLWPKRLDASIVETGSMNIRDPWEPEPPEETARRGLAEELSVHDIIFDPQRFQDIWQGTDYPMKSFITTYTAMYNGSYKLSSEVANAIWVRVDKMREMVRNNPEKFTPSFVEFVTSHRKLF